MKKKNTLDHRSYRITTTTTTALEYEFDADWSHVSEQNVFDLLVESLGHISILTRRTFGCKV